jgi:hypothetical protein
LWICSGTPHPDVDDEDDASVNELDDRLPKGFSPGPAHTYLLPKCGRMRRLVTLLKGS